MSEDEDDDVFEYLPSLSASCRSDLYIARTRLLAPSGDRYNFWGLFCHNDIRAQEFIGMYAGMWRDISEGVFPFGNRYAVEFSMLHSSLQDSDFFWEDSTPIHTIMSSISTILQTISFF